MAIPLTIVEDVVSERGRYYSQVIAEIANLWGHQQVINGPLLVIPFIEKFVSEEEVKNDAGETETKSKTHYRNQTAIVLPQTLQITADVSERYRKRAIYKSLVYAAKLKVRAEFSRPDIGTLPTHLHRIEWDKARIVVRISDTKSIDAISQLAWNGKTQRLASGTGVGDRIPSGFHSPLSGMGPDTANHRLELYLDLNGSHGLRFAPLGETTIATVTSSWPHPSFAGNLLPDEHTINADGFTASWEIPHLARNYHQMWALDKTQVETTELLAGVDLFEPVFIYSRITRAMKYGLLIVALTYLTFLVFELTTGSSLHVVQYALIGAALALFYLLLLSLAEHIGFTNAYLGATVACVGLISTYVGSVSNSAARGIVLFCLLSMLYGLLYALL
jgi:inner membrane protein